MEVIWKQSIMFLAMCPLPPLDTEHKIENKVLPRVPATEVTSNSPHGVRQILASRSYWTKTEAELHLHLWN